ncbi:cbb3-type cytochrome oxidase assembly protein CcoS [Alkalimonas amylolytica]|uniref:Cytochrome oxidase maturation protein, cbb3-type n=1 Tax=Alkalimonas amylolytica TaxID=152573 RepID=A0A1H4G0U7_ALKAM|nr:cbb3-type cytochrome oxidase assembly protein CcoS [Alkalimonas amylolytica]SEB02342.1 cytochrome oxidase maturation protein, cbb3-type [Alkalimonas amylolytica]
MSVIYVLIPIAVLFVMIGLAIFFWAVKSKQFDDLDKQGFSILFDDEPKAPANTKLTDQSDDTTSNSDHEPR